ncbi:MAG TPA: YchJ family protein [Opitutaceae bacterium]|nr:YchJ family protein [Opitutaceae bacterium]
MTTPPATAPTPQLDSPCPCGSGQTFGACCAPVIKRQRPAATAEALMRSRFTAHVLRDYAHLHRTFLATADKPYVAETDTGGSDLGWTRLVIHSHELGQKPETAFVEFSAYYQDEGVEQVIQEKSEFLRRNGEWFYTRAVRHGPAPIKAGPKVGRNDPCPCGSGKKYKHCCLRA